MRKKGFSLASVANICTILGFLFGLPLSFYGGIQYQKNAMKIPHQVKPTKTCENSDSENDKVQKLKFALYECERKKREACEKLDTLHKVKKIRESLSDPDVVERLHERFKR